ncbi:MAG: methyltransferase domain-containing protein [Hyphomicrobiaceae bacterium]
MTGPEPLFDRRLQRRWLARHASTIAPGDFLRAHVAADLIDRLSIVARRFERGLVIGAGASAARQGLRASGRVGEMLAAEPARALVRAEMSTVIVADSEALPFAPESFDLVVSILDLGLVNDLPGALVQMQRILKPDGLMLATLVGGSSLAELARAFAVAESELAGGVSPRVAPMVDVRDLGALLQRAGFALPVADADRLELTYASPLAAMDELRRLGLGNSLIARSRKPLTRTVLGGVLDAYAAGAKRPDGRVALTLELLTATAWAPHPDQQKPLRPGSAEARLADALGVPETPAGETAPKPKP